MVDSKRERKTWSQLDRQHQGMDGHMEYEDLVRTAQCKQGREEMAPHDDDYDDDECDDYEDDDGYDDDDYD